MIGIARGIVVSVSWLKRKFEPMTMNQFLAGLLLVSALCRPSFGAPLSSNARTVVPSAVRQIISVDYRQLRDSESAVAPKDGSMPGNLKLFECLLKTAGIDLEKEMEQLTFISYRSPDGGRRAVGIAQGTFKQKEFLQKMRLKRLKPEKYLLSYLYPMGSGVQLAFLDSSTILFGENSAIKGAIDVRDNGAESLASNKIVNDLISDVDSATVWSVVDQLGTQSMIKSALGQAASLGDYGLVLKRLLASAYEMNFADGTTLDLNVKTSDTMSAATMALLVKAVVLYDKMSAMPMEKMELDNISVDNAHEMLQIHFKTDNQRFQTLLTSYLFAAVSE
jgi:hypothetical protein